ncbi:HNH endonuclease signature motif containing protein [Aeromicrobium sp. Leaf350]|uniref:HNH endonuclease signature motif containing protein n=1 Tax=Aeromicrobium sp. Leaf350 TaxID=2876565 RepID=UPI001E2B60FE|nr:HNH endonuclease signature motif containing protein [Aeromicrobium sp. Leaf350]
MSSAVTVQALREAAHALNSGDHRTALRAIQVAQDALDAAKAHHLAEMDRTAEFELDGSSTITAWSRLHLRLDAKQTKSLIAADATMRDLPLVAEAATAGQIRLEHVKLFTFGMKHISPQIISNAQPWLLDVAKTNEPVELRRVVRKLREAVYPDELDEAWIKGMAKEDFQLSPVPDGWHLTGFLNTLTGAKFKAVLDSFSIPVTKNDDRSSAERRVASLDKMMTAILESGLPTSKGVRPQVSVIVPVDTLHDAMTSQTMAGGDSAELQGFGPIGPKLLSYITCTGESTPILTSCGDVEQAQILNVGDTIRLATPAQRKAVIAKQAGQCAAPGCTNTHLEIHHVNWWSQGGKTNIDELVGYCECCHMLIHQGLLKVEATGGGQFTMTTRDGRPIDLTLRRTTRERLRTIRRNAQRAREHEPPLRT